MDKNSNIKTSNFDTFNKKSLRKFISFGYAHNILLRVLKMAWSQYKGHKVRIKNVRNGTQVPPVLAFSITSKCNLNCTGCYYKSQSRTGNNDLDDKNIHRILKEAHDLGVRVFFLLGGEPFTKDIFKLTNDLKSSLFLVYTNSTLLDDEKIHRIKGNKHLIPVLSLEGPEYTNHRRGDGVYESIVQVSEKLYKNKVPYGLSFTVNRNNFDEICNIEYIRGIVKKGCIFLKFYSYLPLLENTEDLALTLEQKMKMETFLHNVIESMNVIVMSPVLEKHYFGRCLAAGTGILHISSDGSLEPCPFIAYSNVSVRDMTLKEALKSKFLQEVRMSDELVGDENSIGCVLFEKRHKLEEMLEKTE